MRSVAECLLGLVLLGGMSFDVAGPIKTDGRKPLTTAANQQAFKTDAYLPPTEIAELYFNPDGSCVQDAIAIHATKVNDRNGECLLWNTPYGKAIRGGSTPSRVSAYFAQRGILGWVITKDATWPWMQWAGSTGRGAAVSLDEKHFQTVTYYDLRKHIWYVRDNRTPRLIEPYDDETFYVQHVAGGQWTVILNTPAPPPFAVTEVSRVKFGGMSWLAYWFA